MDLIVIAPELEGLPRMLADLIAGNVERDPSRESLITDLGPGTVNLTVTDAEVEVGLLFDGDRLMIGDVLEEADLSFTCEAEVLMALTNVPLRFGMPDQMTKKGREVAGWLVNGTIKVKGLPRHLRLMIRLQRLFTVT